MFGDPHGIEILGIYESHDSIISFLDLTKGSLAIALLMGKHHGFKLADTKQEDWKSGTKKMPTEMHKTSIKIANTTYE